jgi:predicted ATPase/DNA-binding SARP family transcriptional activator
MSGLTIRLFGSFEARLGDTPLPRLRTRKGQWLLALLALRPGAEVERAWLAGVLWPESAEASALANLRSVLKDLRHALGTEAGRLRCPTTRTLCLDLAGAAVDVLEFDANIARGDTRSLWQAVASYRGPLLEDCSEEWVFQERQSREQDYLEALEALAAQAVADRDASVAERCLRRAVAVDPLRESAQRALMRMLAAEGNYAAALLVYRELRQRLHRVINAAPDGETTALYQQVRAEARERAQVPYTSSALTTPPTRSPDPLLSPPPSDLPPLRLPETFRHNLPLQLTSFVGREREMQEVKRLLTQSRLLTLTGAGGCGKTRLALQVAADLLPDFADGIFFVPLAPISDPPLVISAIAQTLGVREVGGTPLLEGLKAYLRDKQFLLLLDNFEQVLAAAPLVVELLASATQLKILVTSRAVLHLRGEKEFSVPPLSLPDPKHLPALEALSRYSAVELFNQRAQDVMPKFVVTNENAPAVVQICAHLDGLPLAIELAAARIRLLPPQVLLPRLERRLPLLTGGARDLPTRQQTLRSAIAWSYDLLDESQQWLFRRLAVFAGGWTLEAAEAVCSDLRLGVGDYGLPEDRSPIHNPQSKNTEVLDGMASLVENSLIRQEERGSGEPRFNMLETLREYGLERLAESGEETAIRKQHGSFFQALAQAVEPELRSRFAWLERMEVEHDNLRVALKWSLEHPTPDEAGPEAALGLAAALAGFWVSRVHLAEGRQWLEASLALGRVMHGPTFSKALVGAMRVADVQRDRKGFRDLVAEGVALGRETGDRWLLAHSLSYSVSGALYYRGDSQLARKLAEESLALGRELGDQVIMARALMALGDVAKHLRDFEQAMQHHGGSLELFRQLGDPGGIANQLGRLGVIAETLGKYELAQELFRQEEVLAGEIGNRLHVALSLLRQGRVSFARGNWGAARAKLEEALALSHEMGDKGRIGAMLNHLGLVTRAEADLPAAQAFSEQALAVFREAGHKEGTARALVSLGQLAVLVGDYETAYSHLAASLALHRETGDRSAAAICLEEFAGLAASQGRPERASRLFGAAEALRDAIGVEVWAGERAAHDHHEAYARETLGNASFTALWSEGQGMPLEKVIEYALAQGD